MRHAFKTITFGFIFLACSITSAQAIRYAPEDGWNLAFSIGLTGSNDFSKNTIGVGDGQYWSLGGKFAVDVDYQNGLHEWRNSFKIIESFTRTPVLDRFIKGSDQFGLLSDYLYHFSNIDWLGVYGKVQLDTSAFEGRDIRAKEVDYEITDVSGNKSTQAGKTELKLTSPFMPLLLSESVGLFGEILSEDDLSWEVKVGAGAKQTFANGQRVISGSQAGKVFFVKALETFYQFGPEAGTEVRGDWLERSVKYHAGVEAMLPLWSSPSKSDKSAFDLLNIDFTAGLSLELLSYVALGWEFRALRVPQLVDDFQVQNHLMLLFAIEV